MSSPLHFKTISGKVVQRFLRERRSEILKLVEEAYKLHDRGSTVNPNSLFLRFPGKPNARIIALPAFVDHHKPVAGIKWISSFPSNHEADLPRASAVLVLNDYETGFPIACIEASQISSARTAASAAIAANALTPNRPAQACVAIVGAGLIAKQIVHFLVANSWKFDEIRIFDAELEAATAFQDWASNSANGQTVITNSIADAVRDAHLVVFATTAGSPHVKKNIFDDYTSTVLHVSLRDLHPETILNVQNFTDDVDHVLKANTSLHLTSQSVGNSSFIDGTLCDVLMERCDLRFDRARVFSPFGLGVLDLSLGHSIYEWAVRENLAQNVNDFFDGVAKGQ